MAITKKRRLAIDKAFKAKKSGKGGRRSDSKTEMPPSGSRLRKKRGRLVAVKPKRKMKKKTKRRRR